MRFKIAEQEEEEDVIEWELIKDAEAVLLFANHRPVIRIKPDGRVIVFGEYVFTLDLYEFCIGG
jgi:hypothetical protein